jgi:hypothetical protein
MNIVGVNAQAEEIVRIQGVGQEPILIVGAVQDQAVEALTRPARRYRSETLEDGTVVDLFDVLEPGQPGHALAAVKAIPEVAHAVDYDG